MKRTIRYGLGLAGSFVCLWTALRFGWVESLCPVPVPVAADMALLGFAGVAVMAWEGKKPSAWSRRTGWFVTGAVFALVFIGVWSFAPWALLAVGLGGAAMLSEKRSMKSRLAGLGVFGLAAALNFVLLFPVAKHSGVEVVEVPTSSLAAQAFKHVDYADAYRVRLPAGHHPDIDRTTRAVLASLAPCWHSESYHEWVRALINRLTLEPGTPAFGRVYARTPNEILMGADEYHLNVRVSILLSEENGVHSVTVSTIVQFNNWWGRAYFIPVRIGHQIIVPHVVRTSVEQMCQEF